MGDDQSKSLSRRRFLSAGAAGMAALDGRFGSAEAQQTGSGAPRGTAEELVLVNGRIHTMDRNNSIAQAVSIRNGRFFTVGGAAPRRGPGVRMIDLRGRTVVPGIIDNHNHFVLEGNRPGYHTPLENALSIQDVQQIYAARAAGLPNRDAWITTIGGFHTNHLYATPGVSTSGRFPTIGELDAAVPNNPAFMMISFTGPGQTNTVGRSMLRSNGVQVGDDGSVATGFPSSECTKALLFLRQTLLNPESRRRAVIDAMNYAATVGVTTHLDQGAFQAINTAADGAAHEDNFTMHIPFLEVYDKGKGIVRLRINFLHMESDPNTPELVQRLKNAFPFFGDDMVRSGGIGEFIAAGTNDASPFKAA